MTNPNWGLLGGNNAMASFQYGAQLGQQAVDRRDARAQQNAMMELRQRELDAAAEEQQRKTDRDAAERRQDQLPVMGKLLNHATDDSSYQQAMQAAAQYGIDTSHLPETYDPAWVEQQRKMVALVQTLQGQEILSTGGKVAYDKGLRPGDGQFEKFVENYAVASLSHPYTGAQGETRLYTPQLGGTGQVQGAVPYDPSEWEEVPAGGGGGNVTSNFLDGF